MARIKTHVKPGDEVKVIAGNYKGKQGKVLEVHAEREQVIVEGVRVVDPTAAARRKNGSIEIKSNGRVCGTSVCRVARSSDIILISRPSMS